MKNSAFVKLSTEQDSAYVDIYTTYGVSFMKGSYIKLLNTSSAKEYVTNKNRLNNGTDYIAKAQYAKRSEKKVSLKILLEADTMQDFVTRYEAFTDKISSGLIFLKIPSRYRVFKLVYSNITPEQEYRNKKATFTIEFTEPNPKDRIVLES